MRRTGTAFFDDAAGVVLPLDTLVQESDEGLITAVRALVQQRNVDAVVIGLPLLLSGEEGSQVEAVRRIGDAIEEDVPVHYVDERYTTPRHGSSDADATAAVQLLTTYMERREGKDENSL
jgi:putative Holliday junction resolvase